MLNEPQPILPPELERYIFSLSLHGIDHRTHASNLILVAQRVYQWLIPEIFDIVVLRSPSSKSRYESIKPSKADFVRNGSHIHHIVLSDLVALDSRFDFTSEWCLSQCPNIVDLALWSSRVLFSTETIDQLLNLRHLTHLSFNFHNFENALARSGGDLSKQFTTVTHLELFPVMTACNPRTIKKFFPSVTHLAFLGQGTPDSPMVEEVFAIWGDNLKVLIWSPGLGSDPCPEVFPTSGLTDVKDLRLVLLHHGDDWAGSWLRDVKGDGGIWTVAEETVRIRRSRSLLAGNLAR